MPYAAIGHSRLTIASHHRILAYSPMVTGYIGGILDYGRITVK
jgi:hypothetical protein